MDPALAAVTLTTRQVNVLRLLLDRRDFSAEDVAMLAFQTVLRAPGVGRKSVDIIRAWLQAQGLDLRDGPTEEDSARLLRLSRRLERAAALLRRHGYQVQAPPGD